MSAYNFLTNTFTTRNIQLGIALSISAGGVFYFWKNKDKNEIYNHPTRQFAEMALKQDHRIVNYCGRNYKISNYKKVNSDNKSISYRFRIDGMRGQCKVLVKCEKNNHQYFQDLSKGQINFSKLDKDQKLKSPFNPINFNDVFIPDNITANKIKDLIITDGTNDKHKNLLDFDTDSLNKGYVPGVSTLENKGLNKSIENNMEFWRITSLVMVANDSLVFNVRPIGTKHRSYDIEETYYTNNTYFDIVHKLRLFKAKYDEVTTMNVTGDELRDELKALKSTNFENRIQWRKNVMFINGCLILVGIVGYQVFHMRAVDQTGFNISASFLKNNVKIKNWLGNFDVIYGHYKSKPFSKDMQYKLFIMGSKGNAWAYSDLIFDKNNNSYDVSKIKLENNVKEFVELNHFGEVTSTGSGNKTTDK